MQIKTLGELEIGDIFFHINSPKRGEFMVYGNKFFNRGHGRPTRNCINLKTKEVVSKSCPLEVYKTRESKHKEALNKKFKVSNKIV